MRVKLLLAYKGTNYCGWQIQKKDNPPPTIQGELQKVFKKLAGRDISVIASGRTDSGVHALGQVAHADLPDNGARSKDLRRILNALLPTDIRVLATGEVAGNFHARNSAKAKTYIYNFWTDPAYVPPQLADFVWPCGKLNAGAMRDACIPLLGEHDFACFQNHGTEVKSKVRKLVHISLEEMPQLAYLPRHQPFLRLTITATGFLKQMARNIAGFLYEVGRNRLDPALLASLLQGAQRNALPSPTAPASGLSLAKVYYDELLPGKFTHDQHIGDTATWC